MGMPRSKENDRRARMRREKALQYYYNHRSKYLPKVIALDRRCPFCGCHDIRIEASNRLDRLHSDTCIDRAIREEEDARREGWLIEE